MYRPYYAGAACFPIYMNTQPSYLEFVPYTWYIRCATSSFLEYGATDTKQLKGRYMICKAAYTNDPQTLENLCDD